MTPNFSGGSTLNGTSGGDRWARVSVGRLAGCRILFAESTLAALRLGLRMNLKMKLMEITEKIRPTQNTPRNSQPPGDRDQLETARGETRSTR